MYVQNNSQGVPVSEISLQGNTGSEVKTGRLLKMSVNGDVLNKTEWKSGRPWGIVDWAFRITYALQESNLIEAV